MIGLNTSTWAGAVMSIQILIALPRVRRESGHYMDGLGPQRGIAGSRAGYPRPDGLLRAQDAHGGARRPARRCRSVRALPPRVALRAAGSRQPDALRPARPRGVRVPARPRVLLRAVGLPALPRVRGRGAAALGRRRRALRAPPRRADRAGVLPRAGGHGRAALGPARVARRAPARRGAAAAVPRLRPELLERDVLHAQPGHVDALPRGGVLRVAPAHRARGVPVRARARARAGRAA